MATTLLSMVGSRTSADRKTGLLSTLCESLMASSPNIGMCWRTKRPGPTRKAVCRCSARNSRNEGALPCNVAGSRVTTRSIFRKATIMKDAKTLLLEFLAAVTGGQNAAALFAEDGAVELPFLHSVGIPWRHQGRQAISELQASLGRLYLDFAFKPEDTRVLIDTPQQVFAEYMAHPTAAATGRTVHHLFTGRLVARCRSVSLARTVSDRCGSRPFHLFTLLE